jgi:hypothetical protein
VGIWHWLLTVTGSNDTTGVWYGFWSGFGSDLGEFAIVGGLIGVYRSRICHARWCWRVGRTPVEGTEYVVCRKHDPRDPDDDDPPTAEEIAAEYHRNRLHRHKTR